MPAAVYRLVIREDADRIICDLIYYWRVTMLYFAIAMTAGLMIGIRVLFARLKTVEVKK